MQKEFDIIVSLSFQVKVESVKTFVDESHDTRAANRASHSDSDPDVVIEEDVVIDHETNSILKHSMV